MTTLLITGATGYIGRRLKVHLAENPEYRIRLLVRNLDKVSLEDLSRLEVIEGSTFDPKALDQALKEVDVAFYLIHSMGSGTDFEERDRTSAQNFRDACIRNGVKRIIYLGGLGAKKSASKHLLSRIETGEILGAHPDKVQLIWFRAGAIIGSGSASFEIIQHLVQKLPVMITPKWVTTRTQAIAVDDILAYLTAAITLKEKDSLIIDIGSDPMNFTQMMLAAAKVNGLKRILIPVPLLTPKLSSYWLILMTPVPYSIASSLVEGLKSETLVLNDHAIRYFPEIKPMKFEESVKAALDEIVHDQVISRWCDSSAGAFCDIKDLDDTTGAIFRDSREFPLKGLSQNQVFQAVTAVGGTSGWSYTPLWKLRGLIDKMVGGYGLNRGRRTKDSLRPGDAVDFWKVADIKKNRRLLLLAQMKLPGKAWLEFDIQEKALVQTAHFYPNGLLGRLYWYSVLPFHQLVFNGLGKKIIEQAAGLPEAAEKS